MIELAVTLLADDVAALADERVRMVGDVLASTGARSGPWRRLGHAPAVVELPLWADLAGDVRASARSLRGIVIAALGPGVDVAVRAATPERQAPRLVVFDMDSTLIELETIDELARLHGVGEQVAEVTRRAMNGELDFEQSLRHRVACLTGLDAAVCADIAGRLPIMPGARELIRSLRALGCRTAVVSGGFTFAAEALQRAIGLDHAVANQLAIEDGRLTGGLIDPIVTPEGKAATLERLAAEHGVDPAATVAVGDGANDLIMLGRAGYGVAFHAKPKVAAAADTAISAGGLERLLYLFGLSADDIARLAR